MAFGPGALAVPEKRCSQCWGTRPLIVKQSSSVLTAQGHGDRNALRQRWTFRTPDHEAAYE